MAKVVAVLKPNKPANVPNSCRPINLLCVAYKLFERLIYNRIKPIIESVHPDEQAGFRPNRCTLDQRQKGVVFVNLSAAYDTVWHRGLTLKFLKTIPIKADG